MIATTEAVLRAEKLWEYAHVVKRLGPRGAREILVKDTHRDESHAAAR